MLTELVIESDMFIVGEACSMTVTRLPPTLALMLGQVDPARNVLPSCKYFDLEDDHVEIG